MAQFIGLEPWAVIERIQKQQNVCPAASSGASTSTFWTAELTSSLLFAEVQLACIGGSVFRD